MEIELLPTVSLLPENNSLLIATRRAAGRCHQQPLGIEALQDPLHQRPQLQPAELQHHRTGCAPRLRSLPANDHPGGEPPQLPDRGARPAAL